MEQKPCSAINLLDLAGNNCCADCSAPDPLWASLDLGVTLCHECCGVHRGLSVVVRGTRSLTLDRWEAIDIELMRQRGNSSVNQFWEANICAPFKKPTMLSQDHEREEYIRAKWEQGLFRVAHHHLTQPQQAQPQQIQPQQTQSHQSQSLPLPLPQQQSGQQQQQQQQQQPLQHSPIHKMAGQSPKANSPVHLQSEDIRAASPSPSHRTKINSQIDEKFCKVCVLVFSPTPFQAKVITTFCGSIRKSFGKSFSLEGVADPEEQVAVATPDRTSDVHAAFPPRLAAATKSQAVAWSFVEMIQYSQSLVLGDRAVVMPSTREALKRLATTAGPKCPLVIVGIGTGCLEALRFLSSTTATTTTTTVPDTIPSLSPALSSSSPSASQPLRPRTTTPIPVPSREGHYEQLDDTLSSLGEPLTGDLSSLDLNVSVIRLSNSTTALASNISSSSNNIINNINSSSSNNSSNSSSNNINNNSSSNSSSNNTPSNVVPEEIVDPPLNPSLSVCSDVSSSTSSLPRGKNDRGGDATPVELGHTHCLLVTIACPIPLLAVVSQSPPKCPFAVPHRSYENLLPRIISGGGWLNFHSADDPYSFPMHKWYQGVVVTDIHTKAKETSDYLKDKQVTRHIAEQLRKIWNSANVL